MLHFRNGLTLVLVVVALAGCSTSNPSNPPPVVRKPLPQSPQQPVPHSPGPQIPAPVRVPPPQALQAPSNTNLATNLVTRPGLSESLPTTNTLAVTNPALPKLPAPTNSADLAMTTVPRPEPNLHFHPGMPEWVDVSKWSAGENVKLICQTNFGARRFQLSSQQGVMTIQSGSQTVYWNGQGLMLGFAPEWSHNHPFLHRSDLQHTIIPLLTKCISASHEGKVLVIDPGHGGNDPGSRTVVGSRPEKDLTLDWALRARALLTNAGWRVYLTRTNDVEVALSNRVAFAEKLHADLFVSLHFNSIKKSEYTGLETYCMTPAGMPSNLVRGSEDHMALPNNAYDDENLCWAVRLHQAVIRETHATDRAVRRARFMAVLRNQKCPAILIEGGYLSNRSEATKLISESYRQQLAEGLVKALTKQ